MGDPSVAVSDESRDAAQACKAKAIDAVSEGRAVLIFFLKKFVLQIAIFYLYTSANMFRIKHCG